MKKIAIVSAPGIGDALILHIASCQLQAHGIEATTFSNHLPGFGNWLKEYRFSPQPQLDQIQEIFAGFDAIFLQHDNSPKAKAIHSLSLPVYTFYGSHIPSKHGPLKKGFDFVCDPNRTMADNTAAAIEELFAIKAGKENGLKAPSDLMHRKWIKRIAIHPGSADPEKNWPRAKFLELAEKLQKEGYEPVFLAPASERSLWNSPELPNLEALASFIYESGFFIGNDSGPGHLASYLKIPHLIIARDEIQMRLWRPGWTPGTIVFPPGWIPHWKGMRKHWKKFISVNRVINSLKRRCLRN